MRTYFFTYSLALLLSTGLMPLVIGWARHRHWVDAPDPRKVHRKPIARVGGIAIFAASMLAILPVLAIRNTIGDRFRDMGVQVTAMLIGSCLMFGVGLYDDLKHARIRTKLLAQGVSAVLVCASGIHIHQITVGPFATLNLGWMGYLITLLWIIGVTNAINLTDGLDGLAAGISAIACGIIAILAIWQGNVILAVILLALLGSLTGFLLFNFHPAEIFMGDGGSLFLGFMIATASILTAAKTHALVGIALPILVLGIPIFDTLISIVRRVLERRSIMAPDRGHLHHRLLDLGLAQHHVAIVAYIVTAGVAGLGLFMLASENSRSAMVFLACLFLLLMVFRISGAVDLRLALKRIRERTDLSHRQLTERRIFEETQLHFRTAKTFDEWWSCLCLAAERLDCSRIALEVTNRGGDVRHLLWQEEGPEPSPATRQEDTIHVRIPIQDRRVGPPLQVDVDVKVIGSLEGAGRRTTLLARLTEEHGLTTLH